MTYSITTLDTLHTWRWSTLSNGAMSLGSRPNTTMTKRERDRFVMMQGAGLTELCPENWNRRLTIEGAIP